MAQRNPYVDEMQGILGSSAAESQNPLDSRPPKRAKTETLSTCSRSRSNPWSGYSIHSLPDEVARQIMRYVAIDNRTNHPLSEPLSSSILLDLAEGSPLISRLVRPCLLSDYQCVRDLACAADELLFTKAVRRLLRLYKLQAGVLKRFFLFDSITLIAIHAHKEYRDSTYPTCEEDSIIDTCYKSYEMRSRFTNSCLEAAKLVASTRPRLTDISLGAVHHMAIVHPEIIQYLYLLMTYSQQSLEVLRVSQYDSELYMIMQNIHFQNLTVLIIKLTGHNTFSTFLSPVLAFGRLMSKVGHNLRKLALLNFSVWPNCTYTQWSRNTPRLEKLFLGSIARATLLPFLKSFQRQNVKLTTLYLVCNNFSAVAPFLTKYSSLNEIYFGSCREKYQYPKLLSKPSEVLIKKTKGLLNLYLRPSECQVLSQMKALQKLSVDFLISTDRVFCKALESLKKLKQLQINVRFSRTKVSLTRFSSFISRLVTTILSCKALEELVVVKPILDYHSIFSLMFRIGERLKVLSAEIDKPKCTPSECHLDLFGAAVKYNPNLMKLHIGTSERLEAHIADVTPEYKAAVNRFQRFLPNCVLGPLHKEGRCEPGFAHFMKR